jgi:Guanylate kinase
MHIGAHQMRTGIPWRAAPRVLILSASFLERFRSGTATITFASSSCSSAGGISRMSETTAAAATATNDPLRPVVFCGPSGVGKGTLIDLLMKRFPNDQFGFSVSHTTRPPRPGEVDGVHYNFTTVESMKADIAAGKFIEYAEVHGKYYGTRCVFLFDVTARRRMRYSVDCDCVRESHAHVFHLTVLMGWNRCNAAERFAF